MFPHNVLSLLHTPRVPSAGYPSFTPLTRGRLRAFGRRFANLPAELKREIIILAIYVLWEALETDNGVGDISTVELMYEFVGAFNKEYIDLFRRIVLRHLSFREVPPAFEFLQSVFESPGIASAVSTLELRGQGMGRRIDWTLLMDARPHMRRLGSLDFLDIDVEEARIEPLVKGLYHVGFKRCDLSLHHLSVALQNVASFSAQLNDYAAGKTRLAAPLRLDRLFLHAKSAYESLLYSSILSAVQEVTFLCLRGIKKGWRLHASASSVRRLTCLYGLPRSLDNFSVTGNLALGVSDTSLQDILPVIPCEFDSRLTIVVEVTFGTEPEDLLPLWQVLHRCNARAVRVAFILRPRTPEQAATEERLCIRPRLRTSNVTKDNMLCPRAIVEVHDRSRHSPYFSE
ncbi:hypothetical protein CYLTODRAFT_415487 [Cylindrobasidium torrendii FP15055 ss-10]|uniref:F-box domain-containing protein n=1 Tax=Cylindrobasidium torrendii FP15055 ss-10 TaxID=1314674 RepID=A0A0D7AU35_9AGAR|nr:hypothetical protein CYLTODRAFT_415487 [Cylindrobasidium torrendii FP15055 ss-10]